VTRDTRFRQESATLNIPVAGASPFRPNVTDLIGKAFDPFDLTDPFPFYRRARREAPIFYSPELGSWVFSRYEDIRTIFNDWKTFSSENAQSPFWPLAEETQRILREGGFEGRSGLSARIPPEHTRLRTIVQGAFGPRRFKAIEPQIPRLDHMVVVETNQPMSEFDYIIPRPLGFRINMLRSASGRSYLAFCSQKERAAILIRLRKSARPGDALARYPAKLNKILSETRARGYGVRDPDFGGNYDQPRSRVDDGRNSIAVPVHLSGDIAGCINLTWVAKVAAPKAIAERFLADLREAAHTIGNRMSA
jgi:hypothetical protein